MAEFVANPWEADADHANIPFTDQTSGAPSTWDWTFGDGGSSTEKTAIFQQYKDQINDYLQAQGIDVAKAIQDWNEKQKLVQKTSEQTMPGGAMPEK